MVSINSTVVLIDPYISVQPLNLLNEFNDLKFSYVVNKICVIGLIFISIFSKNRCNEEYLFLRFCFQLSRERKSILLPFD